VYMYLCVGANFIAKCFQTFLLFSDKRHTASTKIHKYLSSQFQSIASNVSKFTQMSL